MAVPRSHSYDDVTDPDVPEPDADVRAWQDAKVKTGLKEADEGRFASPEAIRAVIRKYAPDG